MPIGALTLFDLPADRYLDAFHRREVDALVVQEPYKTLFSYSDGRVLFSSSKVPDQIINTVVVRTNVLDRHAHAVRLMLRAYFNTLALWQRDPGEFFREISQHSAAQPELLANAFGEVKFFTAAESQAMLQGYTPKLAVLARKLSELMVLAHLLRQTISTGHLEHLTRSNLHPVTLAR